MIAFLQARSSVVVDHRAFVESIVDMSFTCLVRFDASRTSELLDSLSCHHCLTFPNMPLAEEELSVKVAGLNRVHVNLQGTFKCHLPEDVR